VVFDGGSSGNPGPAYGSYQIERLKDGRARLVRTAFGRAMTNNQAEYETLASALAELVKVIEAAGRDPAQFSLLVLGDSQLLVHQLNGRYRVRSPRLRPIFERVRALLARFGWADVRWQSRVASLQVLGH
jgi:ribonuclease HI